MVDCWFLIISCSLLIVYCLSSIVNGWVDETPPQPLVSAGQDRQPSLWQRRAWKLLAIIGLVKELWKSGLSAGGVRTGQLSCLLCVGGKEDPPITKELGSKRDAAASIHCVKKWTGHILITLFQGHLTPPFCRAADNRWCERRGMIAAATVGGLPRSLTLRYFA